MRGEEPQVEREEIENLRVSIRIDLGLEFLLFHRLRETVMERTAPIEKKNEGRKRIMESSMRPNLEVVERSTE